MTKREFLKNAGLFSVGLAVLPLYQCKNKSDNQSLRTMVEEENQNNAKLFELPELGFASNALMPKIDSETMEIHHSKHHKGYVKKLNKALKQSKFKGMSLQEILASVTNSEENTNVRNNAGGHFNHSLFWKILLPNGSLAPNKELMNRIEKDFGSFDQFTIDFSKEAGSLFGSGWVWLSVGKDQKLFISSTANQDNPLMRNIVNRTGMPILGIDVWEHAYYLNYQNERKKYINNFMTLINWDIVSQNYQKTIA